MIFQKFIEVDSSFFKLFAGETLEEPVTVMVGGSPSNFPVVFFKKSKDDLVEGVRERYPSINIKPETPVLTDKWHNDPLNVRKIIGNFKRDSQENVISASELPDPLHFSFRYFVSSASKDYLEHQEITQWFYAKFQRQGAFAVDEKTVDGFKVAKNYVPYRFTVNPIERNDGIYENSFSFEIETFVQVTEIEDIELLKTLVITPVPNSLTLTIEI